MAPLLKTRITRIYVQKTKQDAKIVDEMMTKYDTNKSGKLEEAQLALMLKDLNGGKEVTKVGTG